MKIAFIVEKFPALSETFILNQITGLIDLEHDVRVFARTGGNQSQVHPDYVKYKLKDRTTYLSLEPANKHLLRLKTLLLTGVNIFKNPAMVARALGILLSREEGFSYEYLYYAFAFLQSRFDIVHCHFGPSGVIGSFLKQAGLKAKLVTTFHGYDVNKLSYQQGQKRYATLFKEGDLFTANTNFTRQQVLQMGAEESKVVVLPVGIRLEQFEYSQKRLPENEPVRMLTVGRFVQKKGYEYSLRAVQKLIASGKRIIYTIVGDGPLKKSLSDLVEELRITDSVVFKGKAAQDEVSRLYGKSHIFLLASVTADDGDKEGQGLVLQEAQACGLPVVSTIHNGIPEGVLDGKSGFLVPEKDIDKLVERLNYLIEHPGVWESMGKTGRDFVEQKYDIGVLSKKLVGLYESLDQ